MSRFFLILGRACRPGASLSVIANLYRRFSLTKALFGKAVRIKAHNLHLGQLFERISHLAFPVIIKAAVWIEE